MIPREKKTWQEARQTCLGMDGDLTSIQSEDEEKIIIRELDRLGVDKAWIGLNDIGNERDFSWSDKRMYVYSNWGSLEPNGWTSENCVNIQPPSKSRKWNDSACNVQMRFVCKVVLDQLNYS